MDESQSFSRVTISSLSNGPARALVKLLSHLSRQECRKLFMVIFLQENEEENEESKTLHNNQVYPGEHLSGRLGPEQMCSTMFMCKGPDAVDFDADFIPIR